MAIPLLGAARKHKKIAFTIIILLIIAGVWLTRSGGSKTITRTVMAQVQKGTVVSSVTGTGQIESSNSVDVKSRVSGDITAVRVAQAQQIKSGDILVVLDSTDAQAAYDTAKANLENAKLTLEKSASDNSSSLVQAQDAVATAQNNLDQSRNSLSKTYEQAFNSAVSTFADLPGVMTGLDDVMTGSNSTVVQNSGTYLNYYTYVINSYGVSTTNLLNLGATYNTAKDSYEATLAEYKQLGRYSDAAAITKLINDSTDACKKISNAIKALTDLIQQYRDVVTANSGAVQSFAVTQQTSLNTYATQINSHLVDLLTTQQSIKTAIQNVESAQSSVDEQKKSLQTLQNLTNPISMQSQQQNVIQKEKALSDAAETLSYYTIKAPFDGTVSAVDVKTGDSISTVVVATVISDTQIASITLNEVDVAKVKVGQKTTLTFDAIDGLSIVGTVSEIDAVGTVSQGVVNYGVTISQDTSDERIKPGMSITAAIITDVRQEVLTIPNGAVKSSAAGNYVLVPQEAITDAAAATGPTGIELKSPTKQQTVTIGLSDGTNTEISSGLRENDWVAVRTVTNTQASSQSGNSVFSIFGGNRGFGGGPSGGGTVIRTNSSGNPPSSGTSGSTNR